MRIYAIFSIILNFQCPYIENISVYILPGMPVCNTRCACVQYPVCLCAISGMPVCNTRMHLNFRVMANLNCHETEALISEIERRPCLWDQNPEFSVIFLWSCSSNEHIQTPHLTVDVRCWTAATAAAACSTAKKHSCERRLGNVLLLNCAARVRPARDACLTGALAFRPGPIPVYIF